MRKTLVRIKKAIKTRPTYAVAADLAGGGAISLVVSLVLALAMDGKALIMMVTGGAEVLFSAAIAIVTRLTVRYYRRRGSDQ